ncbi:MAG: DegT/DnrJ/EryC1/StrS family aminotransferase [Flavobacteriaceae bacterium]
MDKIKVQMVDLMGQYSKIKNQIDRNIISTIESGKFVNGPIVKEFSKNLSNYLDVRNAITCANGTDALQIAFMALDLKAGDEIICPSWTYIATAEAAAILGIKVVFCDVDLDTFNTRADLIEPHINDKTKAIVPVHLYGQSCDMAPIVKLAEKYSLKIIEDNAQAIGCKYKFPDGKIKFTGTLGHIGTTSFYPSKNLGCYGDGGAIFTNDNDLAEKISMIVNHGEKIKYNHEIVGCNSRLDSIQAEILNIKLKLLNEYNSNRKIMAKNYDLAFDKIKEISIPKVISDSDHVYHQYTIRVLNGRRDELKSYLQDFEIPSMIYYPIPIHKQKPYLSFQTLENTDILSNEVISLPIHTEIENSNQDYIIEKLINFFK